MAYCTPGPDSDVHAFFHRMGHCRCQTCRTNFRSKGGLIAHLEEHRERGDRVPDAAFTRLRAEQASNWS